MDASRRHLAHEDNPSVVGSTSTVFYAVLNNCTQQLFSVSVKHNTGASLLL